MEQTYLSFSCCGFSLNLRGGFSSWSSVGRPHTLTAGCGSEINVIVNTIFSVINFKPVIIFNASSVTGDTSSSLHPVCFRRTRWNSNPVKFIGYWILAWTLTFKSNPNLISNMQNYTKPTYKTSVVEHGLASASPHTCWPSSQSWLWTWVVVSLHLQEQSGGELHPYPT